SAPFVRKLEVPVDLLSDVALPERHLFVAFVSGRLLRSLAVVDGGAGQRLVHPLSSVWPEEGIF
ncbi:MAG: hypothetical protein WA813_08795, partial [Beijerinckiaceae bacterium]